MAYKATPHTGTGLTPFAMMFGREMRTKLPMFSCEMKGASDQARDSDAQYKQKMKDYADKGAKEHSINEGDTVLIRREVRGKLDTAYNPEPYQVVDVQGSDMVCSSPDGHVLRRHASVAKKVVPSSPQMANDLSDPNPSPGPRVGSRERRLPSRFKDFEMY